MMKMPFAALALMLSLSLPAMAADLKSEAEAADLGETVIQKVISGDLDGAIAVVKPHVNIPADEYDVVTKKLAESYKSLPSSFGKSTGYALVDTKTIAGTLLHVSFIEKREKRPLRWEFLFYKPATDWRLIGFTFNANVGQLFNAQAVAPKN